MQQKKTSPQFFIIIFFTAIIVSCTEETPLFQRVPSGVSGIDLHNIIVENDSVNQLDNENVYNGAGVAIADFDNNGLQDIYLNNRFIGSQVA